MTSVIFVQGWWTAGLGGWSVGGGGRSSCPCHATEVSSSGAYVRTAAALSVPAACFMLQRRRGRVIAGSAAAVKDLAFLLPSAQSVSHSE